MIRSYKNYIIIIRYLKKNYCIAKFVILYYKAKMNIVNRVSYDQSNKFASNRCINESRAYRSKSYY